MSGPVGSVHGTCAASFVPLREAFAACVGDLEGSGAGLAVVLEGRLVVDLAGGWADAAMGTPWTSATVCPIFSCTKALTAIVLLRHIDSGALSLDAPVASTWPVFGVAGKETVTVRHVLSHSAGLPAVTEPVTIEEANNAIAMAALLAAQAPEWEPGTRHAYHALTYGWLCDGVLRHTAGISVGEAWRVLATRHGIDATIGGTLDASRPLAQIVDPPSGPLAGAFTRRVDSDTPPTREERRARLAARSMRDRAAKPTHPAAAVDHKPR